MIRLRAGLLIVSLLLVLAAAAPLIAPYHPARQFRDFAYVAPVRPHFRDRKGDWHWRPFIYQEELSSVILPAARQGRAKKFPLYFFVRGETYQWFGWNWNVHLFGLQQEGFPLPLMGTDGLGRDLLSRTLYGARVSLTIGIVGVLLALAMGLTLGAAAGFWGGWLDAVIMRTADLFFSLPGVFILLALRALFPPRLSDQSYAVLALLLALVGWPVVARVVRGQVLSLKTLEYVTAARACGASSWRILRIHILPFLIGTLAVQATVLAPAFILGEVTLSFLGLGIQEPQASWGNLLASAASLSALTHFYWLLYPGLLLVATTLSFHLLGERSEQWQSRAPWW
ncbi:MAG: ABC transporter permease [Acidobacteria bacterium]|nr:ABC transporter permease [Acidobacteriota bacterium]